MSALSGRNGNLYLGDVGFPDDVTPAALISAFPGINYVRTKNLQSKHIDDALLRCYAEKGFWEIFPKAIKGVEYERVSEKGILGFCFGYSERARGSTRVLKLRKPAVTQEFVSNLVKAHQSCEHNDPIRLEIADISHQNQDDFDYSKQPIDADVSFTAILPGDNPLKVSYYATCNTWFIQRGFE
ncbi:hypothetical protein AAVH_13889 [Aphelenchoides avenae]|nr:hypothetical protein AAVH_13889 [Aphelenchus avenae]